MEPERKKSNPKEQTTAKKKLFPKEAGKKRPRIDPDSDCDSSFEPFTVSTDDEDSATEECVYCNQPYKNDESGEQWIRCIKCLRWVHELCAGIEKGRWKTYVCDMCL